MENKLITYHEHKFVKKLISDLAFYYREEKLGDNCKYCQSVFSSLTKVKASLEQLKMIRVLLAETVSISHTPNSTISKTTLIRYHIENYFLRLTTYKDAIIHLVASIHEWKLPQNLGAKDRLKKEAKKAGIAYVDNILSDLDTLYKNVSAVRNRIAHQGSTDDVDILIAQLYHELSNFIDELPSEWASLKDQARFFDEEISSILTYAASAKNLDEMIKIEEDLATNLFSILNLIYTDYLMHIPDFHLFT